MSFQDLPDAWTEQPLTDPRLVADVLDLVVSDADRRAGGLAMLMCDDKARLTQPVFISDLDFESSEAERCLMFGRFIAHLASEVDSISILFALAREDGLSITADDQSWARAIQYACSGEVRMLGFHVVTLVGSRLVPGTVAAA